MEVAVIGAGYVGLVHAAGLASLGHRVRVGENNPEKLELLEVGTSPIFEPGLESILGEGLATGLLSFEASNEAVVGAAEVVFVAVPTPQGDNGAANMSIVSAVLDEIAPKLAGDTLVVFKSTVPVGSVAKYQQFFDERNPGVTVLSNPEFLREGSAVSDFFHPDRIVIGTTSQRAAERMMELYRDLDAPVVVTDPISSEMVKYGSNAYLATRITFANAMANLAEAVGADVRDVLLGMGYDRRIGHHFLSPGPGFGGSCFPKDTHALVAIAEAANYDFALLKGVIEVNDEQRQRIVDKVVSALPDGIEGAAVGLWGLAFKAGTDDTRDSPAAELARMLAGRGARIRAFDPEATVDLAGVELAADPLDAAKGADVLLIATEWPEFQVVDLRRVRDAMAGSVIVDARNILDPDAVRRLGMEYHGVGR
ncbi:MAG: UDP-glucose/GDP-mannose dehydrogenase family protein [Acidimicrobiia bacterium]|nr:UDP-glucose/GDP-mannose dehydrogenase family protein [Acidimicrobiia bacterium]